MKHGMGWALGVILAGLLGWPSSSVAKTRIVVETDDPAPAAAAPAAAPAKAAEATVSEDATDEAPTGRAARRAKAKKAKEAKRARVEEADDEAPARAKTNYSKGGADLQFFGGYTWLALGDINARMRSLGLPAVNAGIYGGLEVPIRFPGGFGIGPRLYLIKSDSAEIKLGASTSGYYLMDIPLELGFSYTFRRKMFSMQAGLYPGWQFGVYNAYNTVNGSNSGTAQGWGNGFVMEGKYSVRLNPNHFFIGLDVDYRFLGSIPSFDVTTYNASGSAGATTRAKNNDGSNMALDFSGVSLGGVIGFNF